MTRKDYEAIAKAIKATRDEYAHSWDETHETQGKKAVHDLAVKLCAVMRDDNPRFDRDKFLTACGL